MICISRDKMLIWQTPCLHTFPGKFLGCCSGILELSVSLEQRCHGRPLDGFLAFAALTAGAAARLAAACRASAPSAVDCTRFSSGFCFSSSASLSFSFLITTTSCRLYDRQKYPLIIFTNPFCSASCDVNVITPGIPDLPGGHPTTLVPRKTNQTVMPQAASL